MPPLDVHPSAGANALRAAAIRSIAANCFEPSLLYATPRQAGLWREVFLRHSPVHANPEFARIYREAFERAGERIQAPKVILAGLGCGTGWKERELFLHLKAAGTGALFVAVDVSGELVAESARALAAAGAEQGGSLVCDLAEADFLGAWLGRLDRSLPRVLTFFGLAPNFSPATMGGILRSVLRPGDVLLASAHLAPARDETPDAVRAAMEKVRPQYDNAETLAWLDAAREIWEVDTVTGPAALGVGEVGGIPAFIGSAPWTTGEPFTRWGHTFAPAREPLRLFSSLRYTPALFEATLRRAGFRAELLALTACREEGIWRVEVAEPGI